MPPKRKTKRKPPKRSKSQSQSQRQSVVVNIGKSSTTKRRRNAGRGGLPPPSHLQNLAPTFVTAPQVDYVGLIGEISRLTAKVQDPVPIRNPVTPLQATLQASNAEAQQMAGVKAEERRAGPTSSNFQAPPSIARHTLEDQTIDAFGNPLLDISSRRSPEPFRQTQQQIIDTIVEKAKLDRKARQFPTLKQLAVRELTRQFSTEQLNRVRPPDPAFNQRLVNPADPPKMTGLGEGGGGLPFAESRRAGPGAPRKDTQQAVPADGTPIAKPTKPPKAPKKEPLSKVAKELKEAANQPGQQRLDPSTFPPKLKK